MTLYHRNHSQSQDLGGDGLLPVLSGECLVLMVEKECHHLPCGDL